MGVLYKLSYTFAIVTDQHKRQKTNTPGSNIMSNNISVSAFEGDNSPGDSSPPSHHNQMNRDAYNSFSNAGSKSNSVRAGAQTDIFSSNLTFASLPHDSDIESLLVPVSLNPRENVLHQSPRLHEQL